MDAIIKLSKSALFEMVMASFEAYAVKHQGSRDLSVETFAHLWGKYTARAGILKCSINHVSVETSAKRKRSGVETKKLSLDIKRDIAQLFNNNSPSDYSYIGTFHSHPYLKSEGVNAAAIRRHKLYNPSEGDHISEFDDYFIVRNKRFSVALIITIFAMDRSDDRLDDSKSDDVFEFSMGNVKLWVKAQCFEHKERNELTEDDLNAFEKFELVVDMLKKYEFDAVIPIPIDTTLECDFLDNFHHMFESFGRVNFSSDKDETYRDANIAERRWFR